MIAYVIHPLARADKLKLRNRGFRVVDIRYKPDFIGDKDIVVPVNTNKKRKRKSKNTKEVAQ